MPKQDIIRHKFIILLSYNFFMIKTVFCENPRLEVAKEIADEYKNGIVGFVGKADSELFKLLERGGNTVTLGSTFDEHVRFIIGCGGYEQIITARRAACGKRLFLITDLIDNICFAKIKAKWDTQIIYQVPEKVFYSYCRFKQSSASAYASLLATLVAFIDTAASRQNAEVLLRPVSRIIDMLNAPLDLANCANLVAKSCETFSEISGGLIYSLTLRPSALPLTTDTVFFTNYLVLAAFIRFTKCDFNGIFIGKDRTFLKSAKALGQKSNNLPLSLTFRDTLRETLKDGEVLSQWAKRYLWESGKKRISVPDSGIVFRSILENEECVQDNGLLATLCRMGFIDYFR